MSKTQAIAAPIFEKYPAINKVFVCGNYGFITHNSAKLYAQGKKEIYEVNRPDAPKEAQQPPVLKNSFKGLNKAQLLDQGQLRGMTLSIEDSNKNLIEQLEAYDAKLKRDDEGNDGTNGAEDIDVTDPENVA